MTAVLVDLDGVLWFSESAHKNAFKRALSPILENAPNLIDSTWEFGESTEKYIRRLLELNNFDFSKSVIDGLITKKREFALEISDIPINESLIDSLREIRSLGVLIALVSSSSPSNVQKFLDISNLHIFFDCVIDSSMVKDPKPDPSCYRLALERLGLTPRECIVIEDSESGRIAALSAGISQILTFPDDFSDNQFTPRLISYLDRVI